MPSHCYGIPQSSRPGPLGLLALCLQGSCWVWGRGREKGSPGWCPGSVLLLLNPQGRPVTHILKRRVSNPTPGAMRMGSVFEGHKILRHYNDLWHPKSHSSHVCSVSVALNWHWKEPFPPRLCSAPLQCWDSLGNTKGSGPAIKGVSSHNPEFCVVHIRCLVPALQIHVLMSWKTKYWSWCFELPCRTAFYKLQRVICKRRLFKISGVFLCWPILLSLGEKIRFFFSTRIV